MNPIFKKLNFKSQNPIYVINAPDSFQKELRELPAETEIRTGLAKARDIDFFLGFVTKQKEVDELAKTVSLAVAADAVIWFAYPKGSSKKYKCEFNRDTGWLELGTQGFEGVRMIAIDEDWSALRFRKAEYIKKMTRSFAMSQEGKNKIAAEKSKVKKPGGH